MEGEVYMNIYRIKRREGNHFRYRVISGRYFISDKDVMDGKIPCKEGTILFHGEMNQTSLLPDSILEKVSEKEVEFVTKFIDQSSEFSDLSQKGIEVALKYKEFMAVAKKVNLTDITGIWYKDTLYNAVDKYFEDNNVKMDKDSFALLGKILYRFDLLIDALDSLTFLEDFAINGDSEERKTP